MESNNNDFKICGANFSYWNENPNSFEKVLNKSNLSKSNWRKIIRYKYLSYNFAKKFKIELSDYIKFKIEFSSAGLHYRSFNSIKSGSQEDLIFHQKNNVAIYKVFPYVIDWVDFSTNNELTEKQISFLRNNVKWVFISKYQKLSTSFIKEFEDYIVFDCLAKNYKVKYDDEFLEYMLRKTDEYNVSQEYIYKRYYIHKLNLPEVITEIISSYIQLD